MKQIIDGKIYNTETAKELFTAKNGYAGDHGCWEETLYRTQKGAYFIAGEGGPRSRYAVTVSQNCWSGGSGMRTLSRQEAFEWAEAHATTEFSEHEFADLLIEA